ncbi:MAG: hypothetical protein ABI317_00100 [Gaiellales bacterium]
MSGLLRVGRALVAVVIVFAAYGWLDLLRHLPGPHVPLVLPLRGNGGGDDVSLVTVILVCAVSFAAIARVAPPRHRARAALVRAVLFGAFVIVVVALQQGIVEQSQPGFAWTSATWLAWPWIAAVCAGLGTWAGTPGTREQGDAPVSTPTASESRVLEASAV